MASRSGERATTGLRNAASSAAGNPFAQGARNPLALPVHLLPGVGAVRSSALAEVGVSTVGDLLRNVPRRYIDRSAIPPIGGITSGDEEITVIGRVVRLHTFSGRGKRTVVTLNDGTGRLECVWFGDVGWLHRVFAPGDSVAVSGKPRRFRGWQMTHPEFEVVGDMGDDLTHVGRIIPVYSQKGGLGDSGLHTRGMRTLLRRTFAWLDNRITDPLPGHVIESEGLPALMDAFRQIHFPDSFEQAECARARLVFDEFFGLELALARQRYRFAAESKGIEFTEVGERFSRVLERLPFELTEGQKRVLREIRRDMKRPSPMSRLLQGDVGSGKTLVALMCAVMAADNGYQTAIMAPTEVLAEQHALTMGRTLFEVGLDSVLITGSTPAAQRRRALEEVASGQVPVVIGTHALLGKDVDFHRLGLIVVDEQHRFGVVQRESLRQKGEVMPDMLVMTATPIPRSLAQTLFGDLDVSVLDEKPPGRQPIVTSLCPRGKEERTWHAVREAVGRGEQAYVVFPLVEESESIDMKAATSGHAELAAGPLSGLRLGLLHGRMNPAERDRTMQEFKAGRLDVLVSTTVIEVGVDVPNATVMIIEGAERFGLSQLHQLRGRIGRSEKPSACWLIPGADELTDEGRRRLEAMAASDDGFDLAEVDLEIRGPGEFFGTKQSGMPEFRLAHIVRDAAVLSRARNAAFALVAEDPELEVSEHRSLRALCRRYERLLAEAGERTVA